VKLPLIKRLSPEDLGGNVPGWATTFMAQLNGFLEPVTKALQGRLTFEDNFYANVKQVTFTNGEELSVNPGTAGTQRVVGVLWLSAGGKEVTSFKWTYKDNGTIGITFKFTGGGSAKCRILFLLG